MHWDFNKLLEHFSADGKASLLQEGLFGLEKENLRIQPSGDLALTPFPKGLGSSLTNPHITTDFSESQIEMITSPFSSIEGAFEHLMTLEKETMASLENGEMLWPFSMPCRLPEEGKLPIAKYDDTPEGNRRELYRKGLAIRYGRMMQMLCGIHYNFSFGEMFWTELMALTKATVPRQSFVNNAYLHLTRNFLRDRWMLVYILGASPMADKSYTCKALAKDRSKAISLRLSRCGYTNPAKIDVSYNDFDEHVSDIAKTVSTPYGPYSQLDSSQQINDHLLQIANEFYAPIRLKPPVSDNLLHGLQEEGAAYVEVRLLDINPFTPCGITLNEAYFLHLFLVHCLMQSSPPLSEAQRQDTGYIQEEVSVYGQMLFPEGREDLLARMEELVPLAQLLDDQKVDRPYMKALEYYRAEVNEPKELPWKRMLDELNKTGEDFITYGVKLAKKS
ncbi:MAG: hypothetical protein Q8P27_00810, partial [Candidatus Peregrinibacteria bacterium]|nr:hypothetical protein [Candidatus Peregrinibacteria bacterium]